MDEGKYRIAALASGLQVLEALGETAGARLGLAEISAVTGIDKSRTFRILETLRESGYVVRDGEDKVFMLGPKVLALRTAAMANLDISQIAQPIMHSLSLELHESISLGVLDGTNVRYVARVPYRRIISANIEVGTVLPAHATSMGKLLLAHLPQDTVGELYGSTPLLRLTPKTITDLTVLQEVLGCIREQGYAVSDQELEPGLWGLAVPVLDRSGTAVASLSISSPTAREPQAPPMLPSLLAAASDISQTLGWSAPARSPQHVS